MTTEKTVHAPTPWETLGKAYFEAATDHERERDTIQALVDALEAAAVALASSSPLSDYPWTRQRHQEAETQARAALAAVKESHA